MKEYLDSRYGRNYLVLHSIGNDYVSYFLKGELIEYLTIGKDGDNIVCVDPPGGPYMEVGEFKHKDMLLSKIEFDIPEGCKLTFKL